VVHDVHVGVPLDVSDVGVLRHQVVDDREDEVLYLRVAHVENQLRAAAPEHGVSSRGLDDPVGVLLVEHALGVGHLRLYPDAELHAVLLGIVEEPLDAVRQFVFVDHPVAECAVVGLARIFLAKPAIVHDKELAAHIGDVAHHLVHALLVDVEVDTLPAVEQYHALLVAVGEHILASPAVEVTAHAGESLFGEGQGQGRCDEGLATAQMVFRIGLINACEEVVIAAVVGDSAQFVVTAIAEGSTDDVAAVLPSFAVEREHHLGVGRLRVVHTGMAAHDELTGIQRLGGDIGLTAPCTTEMAGPHITAPDGQHGRGEGGQGDGALFLIGDLCPCLDHVGIGIGAVLQIDIEVIYGILKMDGGHLALGIRTGNDELCREVAISVTAGKGCRIRAIHTIGRIGIHAAALWTLQCLQVSGGEP